MNLTINGTHLTWHINGTLVNKQLKQAVEHSDDVGGASLKP